MADISDIVSLALSIGVVVLLLALAWMLGVTAVRAVARARRSVEESAARLALLEREIRGGLRGATAQLEATQVVLARVATR